MEQHSPVHDARHVPSSQDQIVPPQHIPFSNKSRRQTQDAVDEGQEARYPQPSPHIDGSRSDKARVHGAISGSEDGMRVESAGQKKKNRCGSTEARTTLSRRRRRWWWCTEGAAMRLKSKRPYVPYTRYVQRASSWLSLYCTNYFWLCLPSTSAVHRFMQHAGGQSEVL